MNFGGIDPEYAALETAAFVVVPVPYDLTTTYQGGARKGPSAILEASCNMELYDEELEAEIYKAGIHTLAPRGGRRLRTGRHARACRGSRYRAFSIWGRSR